ncbi:uncharacterized protein EI90DRAFT_266629 [Cantharellus anzutake]|uniref:uncharacterized protein n=1 Tax=Cantharellus anzutake TaxID=1750568 RepID=UPI001906872C|nr:uncharacterized protein EI90DRAFT_266629 [Cantharellus anzutake]KAF8335849.1 hypothetical protein EI90DRAFT_266629 [Cantharellus anzutake]
MDNDTGSMALTKSYVGYDWLGVGWPWIRNLAIASSNRSCVFFSGNESPHNPRIVACSIEEDRLGEFQVLWELPGPDCWDCGLYLSFDDVLGIMTIGTSQGSVWLVDFGLLGENSVFINGKANIPRELQKNPILALRSYLELPTDNSLCPPPNDFKYTSNMELPFCHQSLEGGAHTQTSFSHHHTSGE